MPFNLKLMLIFLKHPSADRTKYTDIMVTKPPFLSFLFRL